MTRCKRDRRRAAAHRRDERQPRVIDDQHQEEGGDAPDRSSSSSRTALAVQNVKDFVAANADVRKWSRTQVSTETLDLDNVNSANLTQACSVLSKVTEERADGDPDHPKFAWQRNGDLRYSFLYWVDRPQPGGPLGYGPSSADPGDRRDHLGRGLHLRRGAGHLRPVRVDSVRLREQPDLDPDDSRRQDDQRRPRARRPRQSKRAPGRAGSPTAPATWRGSRLRAQGDDVGDRAGQGRRRYRRSRRSRA